MNLENILQFLAVYPLKLYLKVKLQLIEQSKSTINKKYSIGKLNIL